MDSAIEGDAADEDLAGARLGAGLPDAPADPAALKHRSVHGATYTLAAQGARFALQFTGQVLLTRLLSPAEFGLAAMVGPVLGFIQIFNDLGLSQATVQKARLRHEELSALFWVNIGVSTALAALLAALAPAIGAFYGAPAVTPLLWASAALLVATGAGAQHVALLNRRMRYGALAVMDVACAAAAFGCGLAAARLGAGAWSLIVMQAANGAVILVLAWGFSGWLPGPPWRRARIGRLLRFGTHVTGTNVLGYAEANLGPVLLGRFAGAAALGLYDRGFKLVIVPWWQLSLPISRVAVSLLSRLLGFPREYAAAWRRMLRALLLATGPAMVWAAVNADWVTPLVLGRAWAPAAEVVRPLALATLLVPLGAGASWLFVSQGRVRAQFRLALVTALAVVAGAVAGIPWGAVGVARGYLAAALVVQGAPLIVATRQGPIGLAEAWAALWPVLTALAASAAVQVALAARWAELGGAAGLVLSLGAAYAPLPVALACSRGGWGVLSELWHLRAVLAAPVPAARGRAGSA